MKSRLALSATAVGAALLSVLAAGAGRAETSAGAIPQVGVVKASNACFSQSIRVTGFLVPRAEAVVALDGVGAKVTEVLANEGDRVTAGQTLARYTRLVTEGPEAGRTTTITLRAPAAGVVTRSTAAVGATPSPMMPEPLYRIAVENDIELEAEVPSIHVPVLASGQTARIEVAEGRELAGRVRLVPATIDQRTQLGRARLSLERDPALRTGMFARATIDAKRSCGLSVPRSAVRYRTEGTSVQVVRNDVIETRRVQVGLHSDTDTEIRDGLRDGDLVVSNAGGSLQDGDKVKTVEASRGGQR
ncbi:MAG: efflux RND transporter periplasmic adaptor subunit [Hyphomicrobiales bacterium]|nr:efflux RND transporter periplasmic adaptor subunit [Hyphomicrobiales bacterium]